MKKKIHIIRILRLIIQIGFLVLLPALFSQVFGEMKMIVTTLMDGSFNFKEMLPGMIELLIIVPLAVIFGRFVCGWMCAFGTYNDLVYMVFQKLTGKKFKMNARLDKILKSVKYIVLAAIVVGVWILGMKAPTGSNPWDAFGMIKEFPTAFPMLMIGFGILALITVGAALVERFFCRYLCPLGATFTFLSKLRIVSIDKPSEKCGNCRVCTNNCSMGIDLYKNDKVTSGECIYCMKCVESCPRKNVKVNILGQKVSASLASAAAIIGFVGLYTASGVMADVVQMGQTQTVDTSETTADATEDTSEDATVSPTQTPTKAPSKAPAKAHAKKTVKATKTATPAKAPTKAPTTTTKAKTAVKTAVKAVKATTKIYKDGTYTGSGVGFRPGTQVSVTVKSDKITSIKVTATNDDREFYRRAYSAIINKILSRQNTSVSGVSGATYSCEGIRSAVANALSKARI